mmetsp:Transcript_495/g.1891  ORF Transcript_495/g.1891 Transcript_495/m.1891 type:complete len:445 (-) Transcript_495:24-1358(-)
MATISSTFPWRGNVAAATQPCPGKLSRLMPGPPMSRKYQFDRQSPIPKPENAAPNDREYLQSSPSGAAAALPPLALVGASSAQGARFAAADENMSSAAPGCAQPPPWSVTRHPACAPCALTSIVMEGSSSSSTSRAPNLRTCAPMLFFNTSIKAYSVCASATTADAAPHGVRTFRVWRSGSGLHSSKWPFSPGTLTRTCGAAPYFSAQKAEASSTATCASSSKLYHPTTVPASSRSLRLCPSADALSRSLACVATARVTAAHCRARCPLDTSRDTSVSARASIACPTSLPGPAGASRARTTASRCWSMNRWPEATMSSATLWAPPLNPPRPSLALSRDRVEAGVFPQYLAQAWAARRRLSTNSSTPRTSALRLAGRASSTRNWASTRSFTESCEYTPALCASARAPSSPARIADCMNARCWRIEIPLTRATADDTRMEPAPARG